MNSLDIILTALPWLFGLAFLYACWWVACELDAAPTISSEHPESVSSLDRLQTVGFAGYRGGS